MPKPAQVRFPLYAKILSWFFLNLLVLAAVGYVAFKIQFRAGLDSLLLGAAGERIQAVSEVITADLDDQPAAQWTSVLKRFSDAYRVQFLLFRNDGTQVAGEPIELPAEVRARIIERGPAWGGGAGRGGGRGPPAGRGPSRAAERTQPGPHPRFLVQTENPHRYWVGVRIPSPEREVRGPWMMTLLAVSTNLRGGGLFIDLRPWVAVAFGALLFSMLFWIPLVRSLTRSVSQMTGATEKIAEGKFDTRVDDSRSDELGRLGGAINRMAARLAGFVSGQKRFLGDTAHELCSPIARMQVALGILEQRASADQKACVEDVREEVEHMTNLVNELLSFSKAALQSGTLRLQPVSLREVVDAVVRREAPPDSRIQIEVNDDVAVLAEPELLQRSLANLLRNALRYAGQAGPIQISARPADGRVTLTVADHGPGVPEEALAKIFDPFYRPEASRDRQTGGVGLGLAIVKTCIESCRGTVSCRNRQPAGFEVIIQLEAARRA